MKWVGHWSAVCEAHPRRGRKYGGAELKAQSGRIINRLSGRGRTLDEVVRYPEPGPLKVSPPLGLYLYGDCL